MVQMVTFLTMGQTQKTAWDRMSQNSKTRENKAPFMVGHRQSFMVGQTPKIMVGHRQKMMVGHSRKSSVGHRSCRLFCEPVSEPERAPGLRNIRAVKTSITAGDGGCIAMTQSVAVRRPMGIMSLR